MVFSYYIYKIPYTVLWHCIRILGLLKPLVFYCGDPIDYYVFAPIEKFLGKVTYVTDKSRTKAFLERIGIAYQTLPVFPRKVVMARHSTHKFPCAGIIRIGLRHGAYHFKKMTSSHNYNQFDLYLMTSRMDVEAGLKLGIRSAKAVGFPKLDPAFDGTINTEVLQAVIKSASLDSQKPTVLFSATYNASGMSAVQQWYGRLVQLTENWNVLVTLHPWVKTVYREKIRNTAGVFYIEDHDTLPYIMLADVVVGDNSSILAECCALDKPIITFSGSHAKRSLDEINKIIDTISYKIRSFDELPSKLDYALNHRDELAEARKVANLIFFDRLDGQAGERAAYEIRHAVKHRKNNDMV
jgi:CDP-glycerol glycerophosphotransferase (TagB/SpsB family)